MNFELPEVKKVTFETENVALMIDIETFLSGEEL